MITKTITEIARGLSKSAKLDICPDAVMYALAHNRAYLDDVTDVAYFDESGVIRVRRMAETGRMRTIAGVRLARPGFGSLKAQAAAVAYTIAREGACGRWVAYNPTADAVVDQLYITNVFERHCIISPYTLAAVLRKNAGMPIYDIVDALYDYIAFALGRVVLNSR